MAKYKKRVDRTKLNRLVQQYMGELDKESLAANSGVGNKTRPGAYPIYVQAENEKVVSKN